MKRITSIPGGLGHRPSASRSRLAATWLLAFSILSAAPQDPFPPGDTSRLLRFSTVTGRYYFGGASRAEPWGEAKTEGVYRNPFTSAVVVRQPDDSWTYL